MGALFALLSAVSYSLVAICVRKAVSSGAADSGILRGLFANVVLLTVAFALTRPAGALATHVTGAGLLAFAAAGFTSGWLAREALYRGIRHVGPSRAAAIKNLNPFVAVILGMVLLGERFSGVAVVGAGVALLGYALLVYEQVRRSSAAGTVPAPSRSVVLGDGTTPAVAPAASLGRMGRGMRRLSGSVYLGYLLATLAAVAFGGGQIFRKVGLADIPDPFLAAFVAAAVSLVAFLVYGAVRGTLRRDFRDLASPRPYYWLAGVAGASGQLCFFIALTHAPVSYVSIIAASDTLLTLVLATVLFRRTEGVNRVLGMAAVAVFGGTVLLALS